MGYAENDGTFGAAGGFRVKHDLAKPLIANWPNPDVIRVGDRYYAFSDPSGYPTTAQAGPALGWTSRQLCEAVSDDGVNWRIVGFIAPDADTPACHVPQALVTQRDGSAWLYLFYACQIGGEPTYDYRYDKIRAMRRPLEPK